MIFRLVLLFHFSRSGILKGKKITATGNGHAVPRGAGTLSVTNGGDLYTYENGVASYSFEEVLNVEDNVARHLGAAFFDAKKRIGNLEFL
jgi:hypothetical protein